MQHSAVAYRRPCGVVIRCKPPCHRLAMSLSRPASCQHSNNLLSNYINSRCKKASQVSAMDAAHILVGRSAKRRRRREDNAAESGIYYQGRKIDVVRTRLAFLPDGLSCWNKSCFGRRTLQSQGLDKKLIRRWDSERELSLRRHRTRDTKYNRLMHKFRHSSTRRLCVGTYVYQIQWNNAM